MIVKDRHFFIPESTIEKQTLIEDENLRAMTIVIKGKHRVYFTEVESDEMMLRSHLKTLRNKYSFEAINIKRCSAKDVMSNIDLIKTDIVIDIRKDVNKGFDSSELSAYLRPYGISYLWLPQLGRKKYRKEGLFRIKDMLRRYNNIIFLGYSRKLLNKICEKLTNEKTIIHLYDDI